MNELACSKCGQPPTFLCQRCLQPYCSRRCQLDDWQDHKDNCYKLPNLITMNISTSASNLSMTSDATTYRREFDNNVNDTPVGNNWKDSNSHKVPFKQYYELHTETKSKKHDLGLNQKLNTHTTNINRNNLGLTVRAKEKSANWRTAYPPPSEIFDARVQFIEEFKQTQFAWITEMKYDRPLRKLQEEMNRNVNQQKPCNQEMLHPGALVAVSLNKMLGRAIIVDCCSEGKKAHVHLIDCGNEIEISYSQIFAPIRIMENLNAFAFRVLMPNQCGRLKLKSVITIKVVGEKNEEGGFYNVEFKMKSIPLQLPVELFSKELSLSVVKCFGDGRNALLRLNGVEDLRLDDILNSEPTVQYEFNNIPNERTFVAARTVGGWKRACLLGVFEENHQFLVYTVDEGFICFSSHIQRIPVQFLTQPMSVFAISSSSPDLMLFETTLAMAKNLSLQLLPTDSKVVGREAKNHLPCTLLDGNRQIVEVVRASVFTGYLDELSLTLWHDRIENGSCVFISHVITFKEIYIASSDTKKYSKLFQHESEHCIPLQAEDNIKNGDIVFVSNLNNKYRGQVITCENRTYNIINIDSGVEQTVKRKNLYKLTNLLRSLPVRCSLVKLMYLESIQTPVAYNKAMAALESCMDNNIEFEAFYCKDAGKYDAIDLLFRTAERQSLCKKLLPLVFEPRGLSREESMSDSLNKLFSFSSQLPENTPLPPSPPDTPIKRITSEAELFCTTVGNVTHKKYTIDDLEVIPIQCGDQATLYILDASNITNLDSPYVTAADFNNKEFLSKMDKYLTMVGEYCSGPNACTAGYAPEKMEICLAIFDDDNQWYRALCVDHHPNDTFSIMFLDYGNIAQVRKKNIMPITPELMFPSNANLVYIEGITTIEQAAKFAQLVYESPIVPAKLVQSSANYAYHAKVYNLDEIIA